MSVSGTDGLTKTKHVVTHCETKPETINYKIKRIKCIPMNLLLMESSEMSLRKIEQRKPDTTKYSILQTSQISDYIRAGTINQLTNIIYCYSNS